jgi:hypothetical protein
VPRGDRLQIVDLLGGDGRQVPHLPEPIRLRVLLEHLDRQPHDLGDRLGAVVVAHDPAGDAGGAAAQAALVDHDHVRSGGGERPGDRESVYPAADY